MKHRWPIRAALTALVGTLALAGGQLANAVPASASTSTTYTSTVSSLSPQAWWQLNDPAGSTTAADSSGNGYTGTVSGSVTFGESGPFAGVTGATFNGSTGYVSTAIDPSGWSGITVGAWVDINSGQRGNPRLMANSHTGEFGGAGFELYDSNISPLGWTFALGTNSAASVAATGTTGSTGQWQFIVGTWSSTTSTLTTYIDGTEAASTSLAGSSVPAGPNDVALGYNPNYSGDYLDGTMAQDMLLNYALSPAQVKSLYSGSLASATTSGDNSSWTATLNPGTLSFVSTPSDLTFPAIALDGKDQSTSASLPIDVGDNTGSGAGWNVTITSTSFSDGSATLPSSATSVNTAPSVSCDVGASCTPATLSSSVTYPMTVPAGSTAPTATRLYSAHAGSGMGDQTVSPTFTLAVPANAASGAYSSDWTLSLVSGP